MKRIYRLISSFSDEESRMGFKNLTDIEISEISDLIDGEVIVDLKYDGEVCHWCDGHLSYNILFVTEDQIEFIKLVDDKIHEGLSGYTKIDDITEEVLFDRFETSVFGFFEVEMQYDFFLWRKNHLTKDDVLDKILKYGVASLSENDKLFLDNKEMLSPYEL